MGCLSAADVKLITAFVKANLRGPCSPGVGIFSFTDGCVDQLRYGPSPTGCFSEIREGFTDVGAFPSIAACAGTPPVSYVFGTSEGFCAPGWRVCRFDDAAVHAVTYANATAFGGCFGYNAADNFDSCLACAVGTPVNQSGMGSDCGYGGPALTSCLASGRVTVTPLSSLLGCGVGTDYSTTGVVCCATGIPGTTTTTQPGATTTITTTTTTTTTVPAVCCDVSVDLFFNTLPAGHRGDGCFGEQNGGICQSLLGFQSVNACSEVFGPGSGVYACLTGTVSAGVCNGSTGFCSPAITGSGICCALASTGTCLEGPDTQSNRDDCATAGGTLSVGTRCLPTGPDSTACQ